MAQTSSDIFPKFVLVRQSITHSFIETHPLLHLELLLNTPPIQVMASYVSYPPHHVHASHPIPASQALDLLSTYLKATETDASLHPNALLTESGPISTNSGSNTGLVLHNLKRVEAGLRGEHLGADLSFSRFGGEGLPQLQDGKDGLKPTNRTNLATGADVNGQVLDVDMENVEEGWQDKSDFEREQEITQGEAGQRMPKVVDGEVPNVMESKSTGNKEDRKRRKQERRMREKSKMEEMRRKHRDEQDED